MQQLDKDKVQEEVNRGTLYAFNTDDGSQLWNFQLSHINTHEVFSGIAITLAP